jgi:hypothetical protein
LEQGTEGVREDGITIIHAQHILSDKKVALYLKKKGKGYETKPKKNTKMKIK